MKLDKKREIEILLEELERTKKAIFNCPKIRYLRFLQRKVRYLEERLKELQI